MGCANVLQKESIKQKEIDLNCEIIKPNHIETNDTINFSKKTIADIYEFKNSLSKNIQINKKEQSSINKYNIKNEETISGPIFNVLKRQVEDYKKRKNV